GRLGVVAAGAMAGMDAHCRSPPCAPRRLRLRRAPGRRPRRLVVAHLALRRDRQAAGAAPGAVAAGSPLRHGHAGARHRRRRRIGAAAAAALPARRRGAGPVRTPGRGRGRAQAPLVTAMQRLLGNLLYLLAWLTGHLPWRWLHALGDGLAWFWRRHGAREARVARRNIELAFPALDEAGRDELHRAVLRTTARQALETLALWTRPHARNLGLIRESHGTALLDDAIAAGRGVIVAAPHYGNWELLNQWLAARTPLSILYRPPESAIGEAFLQRVRADDGGRVTQV